MVFDIADTAALQLASQSGALTDNNWRASVTGNNSSASLLRPLPKFFKLARASGG